MDKRRKAEFAILLVAFLWGITFPLIRQAVADIDPLSFVLFRFILAAVLFLPLLCVFKCSVKQLSQAIIPGLILGLLVWASFLTQTIGMTTIGAGRAAFITGTSTIWVPLLMPLFKLNKPDRYDFFAALMAVLGLYLLTGAKDGQIYVGDWWVLFCALLYAFYIIVMQILLHTNRYQETALAFTQILAVILFCLVSLPFRGTAQIEWNFNVITALIVCAFFATVVTFWLHTTYQRFSTPQRVALIIATEPVFAAMFGYIILSEVLSGLGFVGAAIIIVSIILPPRCRGYFHSLKNAATESASIPQ